MNKRYKVTAQKFYIREQPGMNDAIIGTLDHGEEVQVIDSSEFGWYKIIRTDGLIGWSSQRYLESINAEKTTLTGRCIYVWKLPPVIVAETNVNRFVKKAKQAKFSSVWIKVAEGAEPYRNITGAMQQIFKEVVAGLKAEGIDVWGWHVPFAATTQDAKAEAKLLAKIAADFHLDGLLMDAESGSGFFQGTAETAKTYAQELRNFLEDQGKGLAISSHDIPENFPGFPFDAFAKYATVNAPQVYYGGSSSVESRLNQAISANQDLKLPLVPVGAAWVGEAGGCGSAAACVERGVKFMQLVREHQFPGYSFWHWGGVPNELWNMFFREPI